MARRETMNVSLPRSLREWVDAQVESGGFGTASEYVRHLIREARARSMSHEDIEARLLEALDEGRPEPLTQADWGHIRSEGRLRARTRKRIG